MVKQARLIPLRPNGNPDKSKEILVHFNPQSLRVSHRAEGQRARGQGRSSRRNRTVAATTNHSTTFSGSLSVELLFDNTRTGDDVQVITLKIINFLKPGPADRSARRNNPTVKTRVLFQYGTFLFRGTIDSVDETLDFFSEEGVPLRATVALSMTQVEDRHLDETGAGKENAVAGISGGAATGGTAGSAPGGNGSTSLAGPPAGHSITAPTGTQPLTLANAGESLQDLAQRAGVDWRTVAAANNIDNPRKVPDGAVLNLNVR